VIAPGSTGAATLLTFGRKRIDLDELSKIDAVKKVSYFVEPIDTDHFVPSKAEVTIFRSVLARRLLGSVCKSHLELGSE
jgi:hypothetical protein